MNTVEIIGYKRKILGKRESKKLRHNGFIPCIIYGENEQIYFYSPISLFKNIVYTNKSYFIIVNVENSKHKCILQDIQFHPVSEIILHIDFLKINEEKKIKIKVPINLLGSAIGLKKGGKIIEKMKSIQLFSYPKDIPNHIDIDISNLDNGSSIRVKDIKCKNYKILCNNNFPIVLMRIKKVKEDEKLDDKKTEDDKKEDKKDTKEEATK